MKNVVVLKTLNSGSAQFQYTRNGRIDASQPVFKAIKIQ
jgi:hypothetical protein